jgi:hypothetical protein
MNITVNSIGSDAVLTLEDASSLDGFSGYRLERKQPEDSAWSVWTGSLWASSGASLLTSNKFSDYDLTDGLYQYRYRIEYAAADPSEYKASDWVVIGSEKIGWMFENYEPPEGLFGEVLTADDMRYTYLWGIDFKASNGQVFTDSQIRGKIKSSIAELERALKINISPVRIKTEPDSSQVLGTDYDIEESPYTYRPEKWRVNGPLVLRRRPVLELSRLDFYTIVDAKMLDLLSWVRLDKTKGVVRLSIPRGGGGDEGVYTGTAYGLLMGGSSFRTDYPGAFKVDYTAGYNSAKYIQEDMRDVIGKIAACKMLNVIGDGLIAGYSSSSLSLDGVSESFSSTQSATSAYFGARIKVYLDDIEDYLKRNSRKFSNFMIGSI